MATKRSNPFCGHLEPLRRKAHSEPVRTENSLLKLMSGVRLASRAAEGRNHGGMDASGQQQSGAPCSHCCRMEQEANLIQCQRCFDVFCTRSCSTPNFDIPEDRHFCLECNQAVRLESCHSSVPQASMHSHSLQLV